MHDDEVPIDAALVHRLLADQFPHLADEVIAPVAPWGTDNAIFRIGADHVARLPRIEWASGQISLEATWLPRLAPALPIVLPTPVATGEPAHGYPFPWAVHEWVPGVGAFLDGMADPNRFAHDLADVVRALRAVSTDDAPAARNRARPLAAYDEPTRRAIAAAAHLIDGAAALAEWERALAAPPWPDEPVWVHGDLEGNCLLLDGELHGLIDWGSACAGDPAVDVQVIWSPLFTEASREVFLAALDVDDATLARSRGAAINQACAALPYYLDTYPLIVERSRHKLAALGVGMA